jgi:hypothetical protein
MSDIDDPAKTEWGLSLLLLFLGGGSLLASLIIGLQAAGAPDQFAEFDRPLLAIPAWGAIAVWLAFLIRKGRASNPVYFLAIIWLAIGMVAIYAAQFANA